MKSSCTNVIYWFCFFASTIGTFSIWWNRFIFSIPFIIFFPFLCSFNRYFYFTFALRANVHNYFVT